MTIRHHPFTPKRLIVSALVFLTLDAFWLGVVSKNFYQEQIGHLMAPQPNWIAVVCFYIIYIFGLNYFVISRDFDSSRRALKNGALFGLVCYATYDFTNYATLNHFGFTVVIVDCIWGALVTGVSSFFTVLLCSKRN